jgi:hypothetical protein
METCYVPREMLAPDGSIYTALIPKRIAEMGLPRTKGCIPIPQGLTVMQIPPPPDVVDGETLYEYSGHGAQCVLIGDVVMEKENIRWDPPVNEGEDAWAGGLWGVGSEPDFVIKTPSGMRVNAWTYGPPLCVGASADEKHIWWFSSRDFQIVSGDGRRLVYYGEHEGEGSHLNYTGTDVWGDIPRHIYRAADGALWFHCDFRESRNGVNDVTLRLADTRQ